jgi:hypothetical protein
MIARVITIMEWYMEFRNNIDLELEKFTVIKYNSDKQIWKSFYGNLVKVGGIKFIKNNGIEVLDKVPKTKNLVLVIKDYRLEGDRLTLIKRCGPFNFYLVKVRKKIKVKIFDKLGLEIGDKILYFWVKDGRWELRMMANANSGVKK